MFLPAFSQMLPMNPGQFNYSASGWGNGSVVKRASCFQRTSVQLPAPTSCSSQQAPRGSDAPFWPVRALHTHMHIPTQIGIFTNSKRNCFFYKVTQSQAVIMESSGIYLQAIAIHPQVVYSFTSLTLPGNCVRAQA